MNIIAILRKDIRNIHLENEKIVGDQLIAEANISDAMRKNISVTATGLIHAIRNDDQPGMMELFLAEYGLSTEEGVALMCLAEALLRVPDAETIDELIEDKIAPSSWGEHLGNSSSSLVNASTWALMLTGKVLEDSVSPGIAGLLHNVIKRLGEPVIRLAVTRAMKEMGSQFVLGETISSAEERSSVMAEYGYTYSYDMLGEAALTAKDAASYFEAYKSSIEYLTKQSLNDDIRDNPGISIKLSALHPRYEFNQKQRVMDQLVDRTLTLALLAKQANMGLNIDAEEADRLDLSLDVIEAVLRDDRLAGWDGFGVVVQAYSKRASKVIDWLYALAGTLSRKIMVRLVKGAYWDSEIKKAQVEGLKDFPVFTRKSASDVSYIGCAKKLLLMSDRIYPQFATHNAHSVCAILELANGTANFEFQRLHGMGEVLHRLVKEKYNIRCRIYAPVGAHRDLLAYLVRRLLENGANSSFVNQIIDETVPAEIVAGDPFEILEDLSRRQSEIIKNPRDLFLPERINSMGLDLKNVDDLNTIQKTRDSYKSCTWNAAPIVAFDFEGEPIQIVTNPADRHDHIGDVIEATQDDVYRALDAAKKWTDTTPKHRAVVLNRAADLYEENFGELFAVLCREAGKTPQDCIGELREAIDFLRYYATQTDPEEGRQARGLITCISPWNFPLAIFTGQIAAALAVGNGVLAKPADPTPIVASIAVKLLHQAGVPGEVLQLLPGAGSVVGAKLVASAKIDGVCFTGSMETAQIIHKAMAKHLKPDAPFVAETGGINAMIVDSTALPEQAIKDIIVSAFQSAGQRCSALRLLYLQEDIAEPFLEMLIGAMEEQKLGNPWEFSTDIGPVINEVARNKINTHVEQATNEGRLIKQISPPGGANFVGPAIIRVSGMDDMFEEIFGPILHVATFKSAEINQIVDDINDSGYGLTFGLHTRIDDRVEMITSKLNVGNMYINRNQIGAIVGSQPFGGECLSGTGPKAGGPHYVQRFTKAIEQVEGVARGVAVGGNYVSFGDVQSALNRLPDVSNNKLGVIELPGPTGESNRLSIFPRGTVLCLGPHLDDLKIQTQLAKEQGCNVLAICPGAGEFDGVLDRKHLENLNGFSAVALWSDVEDMRLARCALAKRKGEIVQLVSRGEMVKNCMVERHICIDTTASGGNTMLLAGSD